MKKIFTILLVGCVAATAHAQQLSAGFQTGASYWLQHQQQRSLAKSAVSDHHISWEQTLFARYETKNRLAFEVGLNHNKLKQYGVVSWVLGDEGLDGETTRSTTHYTTLNVSIQYDITCPHMQECPVMKKFKDYVGVMVAPVWVNQKTDHYGEDFTRTNVDHSVKSSQVQIWAGLNNTISYALCDHLNILSVVSFQVQPEDFFSKSKPANRVNADSRFSYQFGIAYKFQ